MASDCAARFQNSSFMERHRFLKAFTTPSLFLRVRNPFLEYDSSVAVVFQGKATAGFGIQHLCEPLLVLCLLSGTRLQHDEVHGLLCLELLSYENRGSSDGP